MSASQFVERHLTSICSCWFQSPIMESCIFLVMHLAQEHEEESAFLHSLASHATAFHAVPIFTKAVRSWSEGRECFGIQPQGTSSSDRWPSRSSSSTVSKG